MSKLKLFLIAMTLSAGALLLMFYIAHQKEIRSLHHELLPLGNDMFMTSQLTPVEIGSLRHRGIKTVIDLRPDGEAEDQPSSVEIGRATRINLMNFFYIPIPHESIPDESVEKLTAALAHHSTPTVLYCRTGRRAVRTFALAEASRADGPDCEAILAMARISGFAADDLKSNISDRISRRSSTPSTTK